TAGLGTQAAQTECFRLAEQRGAAVKSGGFP
ncbi:hypothetical protein A2U01_0059961, partial [Trifolium medium]|nr:hypothetical protein [Trifolium medium]